MKTCKEKINTYFNCIKIYESIKYKYYKVLKNQLFTFKILKIVSTHSKFHWKYMSAINLLVFKLHANIYFNINPLSSDKCSVTEYKSRFLKTWKLNLPIQLAVALCQHSWRSSKIPYERVAKTKPNA